jgi:hypothetical protein
MPNQQYNLFGKKVSQTYHNLLQSGSDGKFYDGDGNEVTINATIPNIYVKYSQTASFATTGSNIFIGNQTITGSLIHGLEGNIATGEYSHAEGSITKATGDYSHAEGDNTRAIGNYSHAEGQETIVLASSQYSHAEGFNTIASANYQHVQGQWNATSSIPAAFIVGNGTGNSNRSNLIHAAGNEVQISGSIIFNEGARITPTYYGNTYTGYIDIVAGGPNGFVELISYNSQSSFSVTDGGIYLQTSASHNWDFNSNGTTTIPGGVTAPSFTGSLFGTASYSITSNYATSAGSTTTATNFSVLTTTNAADPIDLTKQVHKLVQGQYTLIDGTEGQILYFTLKDNADYTLVNITINHARYIRIGAIAETLIDSKWTPFVGGPTGSDATYQIPGIATAIFTDGAWNVMVGGTLTY